MKAFPTYDMALAIKHRNVRPTNLMPITHAFLCSNASPAINLTTAVVKSLFFTQDFISKIFHK